jgi:TolB-like protein/Tfp pilus assembly protein PilF
VAEASHAVFLSYASQDAEAAQRICEALRAASIEVFLDQSELRGGDAWEQKIRREIHDCILFIPIVSRHTQERLEGYFRHEWKLAIERTHHMAEQKAFLVPVVVDGTSDQEAFVPDAFRDVQWTRLPAGETPPEFVTRIQKLLSGESGPVTTMTRRAAAVTSSRPSRLMPVVPAVVLAAVAAYLLIEKPWTVKPVPPAAFSPPLHSIAVLPFVNMSEDKEQEYFSDGLTDDLITALTQFQELKVIGRYSSSQFRNSRDDSRTIGEKLGVAHLLEGSVRRSGKVVRVSAELINTVDGSTLWSERYDRPYEDLFALQDDITQSVARALKANLSSDRSATASERPPSGSLEAYNALLEGKFYYARHTEADFRTAIERFTLATQLDPQYALAWSFLSRAWTFLASDYGAAAQQSFAKARVAADTALRLAPDLASAHIALGHLLSLADFDWRGAEKEYQRAFALAPGDPDAILNLGGVLAILGEADSAIKLAQQALATDPVNARLYRVLALWLCGVNRLGEAEQAIQKTLALQPTAGYTYEILTMIYVQKGDAGAALAAAQREPSKLHRVIALALARQIGSDHAAADESLRTLIDNYGSVAAFQVAEVYAIRRDADQMFSWLERAWSIRDTGISLMLFDPLILRYKHDPRFAAFCRKVGLPPPSETSIK